MSKIFYSQTACLWFWKPKFDEFQSFFAIFANIETFHHEFIIRTKKALKSLFYESENQILTNFTHFLVTNSQTSCSKSEFCKYIQTFHDELIITATKLWSHLFMILKAKIWRISKFFCSPTDSDLLLEISILQIFNLFMMN